MAHEIYQEKFYSHREPAWHGLGIVNEDKLNALETAKLIDIPVVDTVGIKTVDDVVLNGYKAIRINGSPSVIVSRDYYEITHTDFLKAWDKATNAHIETMGVLKNGEVLFVTTKLPGFDIKGVEHENYLMAVNPVTGKDAVTIRETVVRVVCANTLSASGSNFTSEYRCTHSKGQYEQMEKWITESWEKRLATSEAIQEAYNVLASHAITPPETKGVLSDVYPLAQRPDVDPLVSDGLDVLADWNKQCRLQSARHEAVMNLFSGKGVGSDQPDVAGTAYGLFNSISEYEQYDRPRGRNSSLVFGAGANRLNVALQSTLALVQ